MLLMGKYRTPPPFNLLIETCSIANETFRYPKHVWSPAGGWYAQPANWKSNTAIMLGIVIGLTAMVWKVSAEREVRTRFPEKGRFFPSRWFVPIVIVQGEVHVTHEKLGGASK